MGQCAGTHRGMWRACLAVSVGGRLKFFGNVTIVIEVFAANNNIATCFPLRDCIDYRDFDTSDHVAACSKDRFVDFWQLAGLRDLGHRLILCLWYLFRVQQFWHSHNLL